MSLTTTTLALPVAATDVMVAVTSGAALAVGHLLAIDSEFLQIPASYTPPGSDAVPVLRGREGTWAAAHAAGTVVTCGTPQDFEPVPALKEWQLRAALNPASVMPMGWPPSDATIPGTLPSFEPAALAVVPRTIGRQEVDALLGFVGATTVNIPYNAGDFSAVSGGTWTVPSAPSPYAFVQAGHVLLYTIEIDTSTIAGTVNWLQVALPLTAMGTAMGTGATVRACHQTGWIFNNAVWSLGWIGINPVAYPGVLRIGLNPSLPNFVAGAFQCIFTVSLIV